MPFRPLSSHSENGEDDDFEVDWALVYEFDEIGTAGERRITNLD